MLKHGILGLLNYGDMSGYEIREVFQDSLNYFWTAQTSQIYREIGVLEQNADGKAERKTGQKYLLDYGPGKKGIAALAVRSGYR